MTNPNPSRSAVDHTILLALSLDRAAQQIATEEAQLAQNTLPDSYISESMAAAQGDLNLPKEIEFDERAIICEFEQNRSFITAKIIARSASAIDDFAGRTGILAAGDAVLQHVYFDASGAASVLLDNTPEIRNALATSASISVLEGSDV